jgi:hypothetical protein
LQEREKTFFIPRMMNSNSLSWASYCSSASDFLSIEESGAACFAELLLKFCCFQPNIEVAVSALNRASHLSTLSTATKKKKKKKQTKCTFYKNTNMMTRYLLSNSGRVQLYH